MHVGAVEKLIQQIQSLLSKKMYTLALGEVLQALQQFPHSIDLRMLHAEIASESRDFYTAALLYEELVAQFPENVKLLVESCTAWSRVGEIEKAIQYGQLAVTLSDSSVRSVLTLTDIYERNNRPDEAEALIQTIQKDVSTNGNYQRLHARLCIARKEYAKAIDYLNSQLETEQDTRKQIKLYFILAKAYDKVGEYDRAWNAAANAHKLDESPFDEHAFFGQFEKMRSFMTKDMVQALVDGPETNMEPLFIVSNPRSGTSLLEQIVGMHSDVSNGGEMPTGSLLQSKVASLTDSFHSWPMSMVDLTPGDMAVLSESYCAHCDFFKKNTRVVSNKALNLHEQLGFLSKVMPNAKAIFLERNPLDHAVSCFMNNLLAAGLPYTNNIEHIGRTWVERKGMAEFWWDMLSIPMLQLRYEELVANQRKETKRVIQFLGLPWQEECMEFHTSTQAPRTISFDQTNKKMYTTSNGRWKNYEKHLGSLIDVVSDYV